MNFAADIERMDRQIQRTLGRKDIEYRPESGPLISGIRGVFDANHLIQDPINSNVEAIGPVVWFRLEDIAPNDPRTDKPVIVIGGVEYRPRERKPDSPVGGSIRILLQLVP